MLSKVAERSYRFSLAHTCGRLLTSLVGWVLILGLPGAVAWAAVDPEYRPAVVAGFVVAVLAGSYWQANRFWRRLRARGPQLELRHGYLRAAQLGDEDVAWTDVVGMGGAAEAAVDFAVLSLELADGRTVELEIDGLDAPMRSILEHARQLWEQRARGPVPDPARPTD